MAEKEGKNINTALKGVLGDNDTLIGLVGGNVRQIETDVEGGLMTFDKGVSKSDINVEGGVTGFNPIGEVKEGDKRAVSGSEVFLSIPKLDTDSKIIDSYLQGNKAISTNGEIITVASGNPYSIIDQPLYKNSTYNLLIGYASTEKYFFLVNDSGQVKLPRVLLNNKITTFQTDNEFYKLRAYIKLTDNLENQSDWRNKLFLLQGVGNTTPLIKSINGIGLEVKAIGKIEQGNINAVSGNEVFNEVLLTDLLTYKSDFEITNYTNYIANNTALGNAGEIITNGANGYDIVLHMPIPLGVKNINISKITGVSGDKTKVISQYNSSKVAVKNQAEVNGDNIVKLEPTCKFISFTLKTPTETIYDIDLYFDTKKTAITEYNGLGFSDYKRNYGFYKKGISLGDSITWYDGKPYGQANYFAGQIAVGYQSYIRKYFNCEYQNEGKSGWDITQILTHLKTFDYKTYDFATLTSMANDARKGIEIGTLKEVGGSFDVNTYIGAMQSGIEFMLNQNPKIRIILMSGVKGWFNEQGTSDVPSQNVDIPITYVDAMKSVAELYSLPLCDWYNNSGINKINRREMMGDLDSLPYYLHPNNLGYERMSSVLIDTFLKSGRYY